MKLIIKNNKLCTTLTTLSLYNVKVYNHVVQKSKFYVIISIHVI